MHPTQARVLADAPLGLPDGDFVMVEWGDPGGVTGPDRPIAALHVHHADDERGTCSRVRSDSASAPT